MVECISCLTLSIFLQRSLFLQTALHPYTLVIQRVDANGQPIKVQDEMTALATNDDDGDDNMGKKLWQRGNRMASIEKKNKQDDNRIQNG